MTQIVTISASTAAIAMEMLRPAQRKSAKTAMEEAERVVRLIDQPDDSEPILPPSESIASVSARLAMLDNGTHHQQTTLHQAVEAYMKCGG